MKSKMTTVAWLDEANNDEANENNDEDDDDSLTSTGFVEDNIANNNTNDDTEERVVTQENENNGNETSSIATSSTVTPSRTILSIQPMAHKRKHANKKVVIKKGGQKQMEKMTATQRLGRQWLSKPKKRK